MPTYPIEPMPYRRMTQRSKFSPAALRYYAFKDQCKRYRVDLPLEGAIIKFYISMPKTWKHDKKKRMDLQPHQAGNGPDLSNLLKALEDAVYANDSAIWHYKSLEKRWAYEGSIEIL